MTNTEVSSNPMTQKILIIFQVFATWGTTELFQDLRGIYAVKDGM